MLTGDGRRSTHMENKANRVIIVKELFPLSPDAYLQKYKGTKRKGK